MPIRIPDSLPAREILASENIFVMSERRAIHQDIRPLKVLLLNLMPTKIVTETQILRMLSNTPLQIEVSLMNTSTHVAKNASSQHLDTFYTTFDQVKDRHFDGLIITGAPVELMDFEAVDYWDELMAIMDWSCTNVHSTLHICWGAQAAIYHHYGLRKHALTEKCFGVFEHEVVKPSSPLVRGFDDRFWAPHSRYTEVKAQDIEAHPSLELIATSTEAGVYAAKSTDSRHFFIFGHPEYGRETLREEYLRDQALGKPISIPCHYFPEDDITREPVTTWRSAAQLLYSNWLNYYVYQTTPYDITEAGLKNSSTTDEQDTEPLAPLQTKPPFSDTPKPKKAHYTLKPSRVPLPSKTAAAFNSENESTDATRSSCCQSSFIRPENEDDDGYDPYSDRPAKSEPLFQENPWD